MKRLMVAIAAAAIFFAGFADDTNNWFTAGFGSDGTSTGGAWSESPAPVWGEGDVLLLEEVEASAPVVFEAYESKKSTDTDSTVVFDTTVTFQGFDELPAIDSGAKAGVCALADGNYYVVAENDGTNAWFDTEIPATFGIGVNVKVTVANGMAVYTFTDQFDTYSTDPLALVDAEFQEVCYSGNGSVSTLAADTILAGVEIVVPEIDGLTVTCDDTRAAVGAEVTLNFAADTKIPSIDSATYIVGEDGTLTLKEGEEEVVAQDPGAKIDEDLYLTFAAAYTAADVAGGDIIELCSDQYLESDIEKDISIDLAGNTLTVTNDVAIKDAEVIFDDSAEGEKGKLILGAVVTLDESSTLGISDILWDNEDGGYVTGDGATLYVGMSPNLMFAMGALGESRPDMSITVGNDEDGVLYYLDVEAEIENRYVTDGEVAYATITSNDLEYAETFDTVQAAINAADEVYLSLYAGELPEEYLTFGDDTVVYAEETYGADALVNCNFDPEEVAFDESLGEFGGWKISGEPVAKYTVSWNSVEHATVVAVVDEESIGNGDQVEDGKTVTFTVDPDADYEFAEEEYEGWEITEDGDLTCSVTVDGDNVEITIPEPTEIPVTTKQILLPTGIQGVAGYIVSNVTDNIDIPAEVQEEPVAIGKTYTLPLGKKVEIWVVPADGYRVTGNPYTIDEVTSETTVEVTDLPSVAAIVYVAQIGETQYETLQEAFDAAAAATDSAKTVVLLDNVTVSEGITFAMASKNVILDLNGNVLTSDITVTAPADSTLVFTIKNAKGDPTTGKIVGDITQTNGKITISRSTVQDVTVEGSIILDNVIDASIQGSVVQTDFEKAAITAKGEKTLVKITNVAFVDAAGVAVDAQAGTVKVLSNSGANSSLIAGTITKGEDATVAITGGEFTSDPSDLLSPEYAAVKDGGTWIVAKAVAKIDNKGYATLAAAVAAATDKQTVTLLANVSEKITIAADKDLTLDLNEKTLTGTDASYVINNLGTLVITGDGVVDSTAVSHNTLIRNGETGVMTIESGTFKSARITVKNDENGKGVCGILTINGGTFLASSEQGAEVWDSVQNWGVATINGGEFDSYIECRAESNWNAGVMTINGGTFQKPVQTVVVFDNTKTPADNAADVALTINGGTFNDMVMRVADVKAKAGEAANVRVDFDATMPEYVASCTTLGTVTIPGLVEEKLNPAIFANDESVYCEEGYKTKDLGDGKYGVEEIAYVAQVGETKYETVAEALAAVQAAETTGNFPIVVKALAEDGLTITDADRTASIAKDVTITITKGTWTVDNVLTYSGAIEGTVIATDILIPDGGSIKLGVNALVTVGLESELSELSFTRPEGNYEVKVMATDENKTFKVVETAAWDIPGAEGGINALVKEDGTKYVEFTSITFTATGATVGLKAAKIAAQAETFGLVCKTDLTKADTFVINASLSVAEGDPDAKNGLFTITADLSDYDQLFVVGVGPAKADD